MQFDERSARRLLWAAGAIMVAGIVAFVLRGADQPADPYFAESESESGSDGRPGDVVRSGDPARMPLAGFDEVAVVVEPADGGPARGWCLLAASQPDQRGRGLMDVTDLRGYSGMAFLYDSDVTNAFYMRDTPTPLSIAWVDAAGAVVSTADMAPCEDREGCPTYPPAGPYRTAIEVFQGRLDDLGISAGARVAVGGRCEDRT